MSRAHFLIHLVSLLLLSEVLGEPFRGSGFVPDRPMYMGLPPWVFVKPWDFWAHRSAILATRELLTPSFSFHAYVLSARALNRVNGRYEYYDVTFVVNFLPESVTDKYYCRARMHWESSSVAHLEPGYPNSCTLFP